MRYEWQVWSKTKYRSHRAGASQERWWGFAMCLHLPILVNITEVANRFILDSNQMVHGTVKGSLNSLADGWGAALHYFNLVDGFVHSERNHLGFRKPLPGQGKTHTHNQINEQKKYIYNNSWLITYSPKSQNWQMYEKTIFASSLIFICLILYKKNVMIKLLITVDLKIT